MPNIRHASLSAFWLVGAALTLSCGDAGSAGRSPLRPGSAAPARIELMAPDAVPPGDTARLAVIAYLDDGSTQDVTTDATYASSDTSVLAVLPGQLIAAARGEATVSVTYLGLSIARVMFAMPTGTFRLTGIVTDTERAVEGADVIVRSGAGTGLMTRTNAVGQYRLYGVAGDTRLEIRKANYTTRIKMIDVSENTQLDVDISPGTV